MRRFDHKVALISGGGTGIGAATARRLAADGASVAVIGRREGPVRAVANEIDGLAITADVSIGADAERAVRDVVERYGRLDVAIANAGGGGIGPAHLTDDPAWLAGIQTNLTTAFSLSRAALPHLIDHQGTVVIVSSMAGLFAPAGAAGYIAGKHGVIGLTRSLARDYGSRGVRVNAVCPGWTRTELSAEIIGDLARERGLGIDGVYAAIAEDLPLGRLCEPDEIASLICFLASTDASAITGVAIPADGGASTIDAGSLAFQRMMGL
jgi:NAD(P)-dependent dehydrogenase (short-subunit alcohol dehydrogenase family)